MTTRVHPFYTALAAPPPPPSLLHNGSRDGPLDLRVNLQEGRVGEPKTQGIFTQLINPPAKSGQTTT